MHTNENSYHRRAAGGPTRQRRDLYRTKASEIKDLAQHIHEPAARDGLITLARGYELLARLGNGQRPA